jgi:hypothetical protein
MNDFLTWTTRTHSSNVSYPALSSQRVNICADVTVPRRTSLIYKVGWKKSSNATSSHPAQPKRMRATAPRTDLIDRSAVIVFPSTTTDRVEAKTGTEKQNQPKQ